MIKESALENSQVVDNEWGRAIFVSTGCRKFFRKAYPGYSKIRNNIMNQFIAKMFSEGKIVDYFKPKNSNADEVGEVREVAGGKFVGIIANDHVRVIAVKGSPSGLPALPQDKVPGHVEMGGTAKPKPVDFGHSGVEKALEQGI